MKKIFSYYWIIIPAIVGIILFTTPLWLEQLLLYSDREFANKQRQDTSLVDYSIPNNLKVRKIYVSDLTGTNQKETTPIEPIETNKVTSYHPDDTIATSLLLDSLNGREIILSIELSLNAKGDTLTLQEKKVLRQNAISLIGMENIMKATHAKIFIYKETNYTIQKDMKYSLADDDYIVLLEQMNIK